MGPRYKHHRRQSRSHRHRLINALETSDDTNLALFQSLSNAARRDVHDARVAVALSGKHASLGACKGLSFRAKGLHGHGHQSVGNALTRGQEHVHLALRRHRVYLGCQIQQLIGGVPHGGADNNHVVARLLGSHNALGDSTDALRGFEG